MQDRHLGVEEWEEGLGWQIRQTRLRLNLTQVEVARRANLDRTTVGRLENGEGGSISSLIQIARTLGREQWLDQFSGLIPTVSPMQKLRDQQQSAQTKRQRARHSPTP